MSTVNMFPQAAPDPDVTFEAFWILYPRHLAKKDAKRAWNALPAELRPHVLERLCMWRNVWIARLDSFDYVPYPSTWLRGERWADELPGEKS